MTKRTNKYVVVNPDGYLYYQSKTLDNVVTWADDMADALFFNNYAAAKFLRDYLVEIGHFCYIKKFEMQEVVTCGAI